MIAFELHEKPFYYAYCIARHRVHGMLRPGGAWWYHVDDVKCGLGSACDRSGVSFRVLQ
jgi:hypothetical protein